MPAKPDCQVSEFCRPGSKLTSLRLSSRLLAFGIRIRSRGWHSRSRITRLAIQSVNTKTSRPMSCPARSCGATLSKYASLSSMSSLYVASMPVALMNCSSVGYFLVSSSKSR